MKQLAQSLKSKVKWINARNVSARPLPGPADRANDNLQGDALRGYMLRARNKAGMDYQSAASKMWWLP